MEQDLCKETRNLREDLGHYVQAKRKDLKLKQGLVEMSCQKWTESWISWDIPVSILQVQCHKP